MDYILLGKRIRSERMKLNLTQEKLAEDTGISTAYLGQIERGERNVTLDKLLPIASRLGVTVDFLLTDYLPSKDDNAIDTIRQLLQDKSSLEKELAINMLKLLFSYTEHKL